MDYTEFFKKFGHRKVVDAVRNPITGGVHPADSSITIEELYAAFASRFYTEFTGPTQ